jgi:hypothetical protein
MSGIIHIEPIRIAIAEHAIGVGRDDERGKARIGREPCVEAAQGCRNALIDRQQRQRAVTRLIVTH